MALERFEAERFEAEHAERAVILAGVRHDLVAAQGRYTDPFYRDLIAFLMPEVLRWRAAIWCQAFTAEELACWHEVLMVYYDLQRWGPFPGHDGEQLVCPLADRPYPRRLREYPTAHPQARPLAEEAIDADVPQEIED